MVSIEYSPPKKITILVSFIFLIIGIILFAIGYTGNATEWLSFLGTFGKPNWIAALLGLGSCALAWLLMIIGVFFRGI